MLGHASMRLRQLCRSAISGGHGTAQPASVKPDAAVASTVTVVPAAQLSEQWKPQEIPSGLLVTVPLPAPVIETLGRWSKPRTSPWRTWRRRSYASRISCANCSGPTGRLIRTRGYLTDVRVIGDSLPASRARAAQSLESGA